MVQCLVVRNFVMLCVGVMAFPVHYLSPVMDVANPLILNTLRSVWLAAWFTDDTMLCVMNS